MNFSSLASLDKNIITLILGIILGVLPFIYKMLRTKKRDEEAHRRELDSLQVKLAEQLSNEETKMRDALLNQIETMKQEIKELKEENAKLFAENVELKKRVLDLEIIIKQMASKTKKKPPKK